MYEQTMLNSNEANKQRNRLSAERLRARNKAMRLGEAISDAGERQKVGRKVKKDPTEHGNERRQAARVRYRKRAQKKRVINCSIVCSLTRNLRSRARTGDGNVTGLAGGKVLELCDLIDSNFSKIKDAKDTMKSFMDLLDSGTTHDIVKNVELLSNIWISSEVSALRRTEPTTWLIRRASCRG